MRFSRPERFLSGFCADAEGLRYALLDAQSVFNGMAWIEAELFEHGCVRKPAARQ